MDPDDHQSGRLITLGPRASVGQCAKPIDARERAELSEDNLATWTRRGDRGRVDSHGRADERRKFVGGGDAELKCVSALDSVREAGGPSQVFRAGKLLEHECGDV